MKEKAKEAKVKNIIEMAATFSAMARVFKSESMEKIKPKVMECLEKLQDVRTESEYHKHHDEFCTWFTRTIKTAKTQRLASWGQAAKILDVALKVCVYYCHLPSEEASQRIVPWLNPAIDTPLLKNLKRRYDFSGASTLADIDIEKYEELQKIIRTDIERSFNGEVYPVQYDDIKWRELNRNS
jgi:hypothetical protein